jgi:hypothetical protein
MDKTINYIISKLKVISKLQSGNKLMIEDNRINIMECDKNSWDRFIKWWLGETRQTTLDKLQSFYMEIKDVINILATHPAENQNTLTRLSTELSSSIRGLNNLMLTYSEDRTVTSQLETLSENFSLEITRITTIITPFLHTTSSPKPKQISPSLIDIEYESNSSELDSEIQS